MAGRQFSGGGWQLSLDFSSLKCSLWEKPPFRNKRLGLLFVFDLSPVKPLVAFLKVSSLSASMSYDHGVSLSRFPILFPRIDALVHACLGRTESLHGCWFLLLHYIDSSLSSYLRMIRDNHTSPNLYE